MPFHTVATDRRFRTRVQNPDDRDSDRLSRSIPGSPAAPVASSCNGALATTTPMLATVSAAGGAAETAASRALAAAALAARAALAASEAATAAEQQAAKAAKKAQKEKGLSFEIDETLLPKNEQTQGSGLGGLFADANSPQDGSQTPQ